LIAILDYGSGNIKSAQRAFSRHGDQVEVTNDFQKCINADGLVIPGVGAFAACMEGLLKHRADAIVDARMTKNLQTLGICRRSFQDLGYLRLRRHIDRPGKIRCAYWTKTTQAHAPLPQCVAKNQGPVAHGLVAGHPYAVNIFFVISLYKYT
jgi:hypothetical protein